jgi:CheY-like chemotaxis protein
MLINIIAIDDEEDVAALYKVYFKKEVKKGLVKLNCFNSGESCLEFLETEEGKDTQLILCDINMPEMDGFEVLEKVKEKYPDIHVYMVSAYDSDEYMGKAESLGAEEYFTKPVDFERLKETIFSFFESRKDSA